MNSCPRRPGIGSRTLTVLVERTVSEWRDDRWQSENRRLSDFRHARAYVLLGEPGAGKTTAFEVEAEEDGNALFVPARRFIRRHFGSHPEWGDRTLLVDGLDELRARRGNPNEPLDAFLCRIEQLGQSRFRLSCREDSWLGRNDFDELVSVTGDDGFHLLRLDPLGLEEARAILADKGIEHPRNFMWRAVDNGLKAFIENPLLLETLADTVASGSWPNGRLDTFKRACGELAKEMSESHLNAQDGRPFSISEIVLASGRLCVLLLLSGKSGWSRRGPGDEDCPALSEAGDRQDLFKVALDSKLFEGSAETGRRPRHRAVGEFLAAKYLDHAIKVKHLAPGRVLAWMLGIDGVVMPDLRSVSVWLAALNSQVRDRLIESDPVGLAFHGDAERFSHQETRCLLNGLEAKLPHLREWPSRPALAALVAGPAREILWEMLRAVERSKARQAVVELLLWGMTASPWSGFRIADGKPSRHAEEAQEALGTAVRDPSWQSTTRHQALVALIHVVGNETDHVSTLRDLLDDLAADKVPADERGDLQGELLLHLYPRHLAVEHVWDYLSYGTVPDSKTRVFWTQHLVHKAPKEDVGFLLDALVARAEELIPRLAQDNLDALVMRLLARGLELFGKEREVAKLYEWFELVSKDYEWGLVPAHCVQVALRSRRLDEQKQIYRWLRAYPDIQLALVLEGLRRHVEWPSTTALDMTIGTKFLDNAVPAGFRKWCLAQAVELATTDPGPSTELAWWAVRNRPEWGPALGDDEVTATVRGVLQLQEWNQKRLAREEAPLPESPTVAEFLRRKETYVASVRGYMDTIQIGQGPPGMLYELGQVYVHGLEAGGPNQARDDLTLHLDSDSELVEAVIRGFRCLVDRSDLPNLNDILQLHQKGKMSVFAFPFLTGLIEDEVAGERPLQRLNEEGLGRALGFYLLSRLPTKCRPSAGVFTLEDEKDCRPCWYRQALRDHPQAVADAFVAVHRVRVRAKEPPDQHLHDLTMSDEYAEVARLAMPRMFTPFPSRCAGGSQLETLRLVLWAALRLCPAALRELARRRLARKGMDTGQRAQWLAAGALTTPDEVLPKLVGFLSEEEATRSRYLERRVHHLVEFLVPDTEPLPNQEWSTTHLAPLIRAVGRCVRPTWSDRHAPSGRSRARRIASADIKAPYLMMHWINKLEGRVDEQAIAVLGNLANDPALETWHGQLARARDAQAEQLRIAKYRTPTLSEIRKAVDDGPPASAADLAALVTEKLNRLADRIRNGNTDDWLQYWHTNPDDSQGRTVIQPKPEELCRDHLLSDLQLWLPPYDVGSLLPYAVDAAPEGHHAEDTRSDILTVHGTHAVPVEIKTTGSGDLWSAIKGQLIANYVRDPRSGGYGIYLVLWFGPELLKSAPPVGARPDSPNRLRQLLEETLEPEQRRTIAIVVVDVSAPSGRRLSEP